MRTAQRTAESVVFERDQIGRLLEALSGRGYEVIGPAIRDGAIVYDRVSSADDLPSGWTDDQTNGKYRLKPRKDRALFGYTVGPRSWKHFLQPPAQRLWQARREPRGFEVTPEEPSSRKYAFIGVRACDLKAIASHDTVFEKGAFADPAYSALRSGLFVVAVNCGHAGGTCFCASMGTGPKATSGFDIALTEILQGGRHYFVAEAGTPAGDEVLSELAHAPASEAEQKAAGHVWAEAERTMGRKLETRGLKDALDRNREHPRWDQVAARCLSCANCTLVCPTCFCTTVEDVTDLGGQQAERWRRWDSCFTAEFSYIHGGSVRSTTRARYRQWLTHKLSTWIDQFGTAGCVGCGRCISWCPVGIDLTEEARAIRESDLSGRGAGSRKDRGDAKP